MSIAVKVKVEDSRLPARQRQCLDILCECDAILRLLEREVTRLARIVPPDQEKMEGLVRRIHSVNSLAKAAADELGVLVNASR